MIAAGMFRDELAVATVSPARITVELFPSVAWTGHGRGSDIAGCLGLLVKIARPTDVDFISYQHYPQKWG
jgi:L-serine dehydratase